MNMKKYLAQMIRQECAALNNAVLSLFEESDDAAQAFAVRTIYGRLNGFVREFVEECDRRAANV